MGKSHRTTISIPSELKARMDAIDEDINWSAVACRAFEQTLGELEARKGTGSTIGSKWTFTLLAYPMED